MRVFQNFVKRFKDLFFMYAIGSRLGVMKVKQSVYEFMLSTILVKHLRGGSGSSSSGDYMSNIEDPLLLKTARNDVVHAQQGNILMFAERQKQMRIFQNFVKRFKDFFFMYAIGSRLGVMKSNTCEGGSGSSSSGDYMSNIEVCRWHTVSYFAGKDTLDS
ncbi:hypothetical protein YC2023_008989 [Brassica napus]